MTEAIVFGVFCVSMLLVGLGFELADEREWDALGED
jgi:hypothetical protein